MTVERHYLLIRNRALFCLFGAVIIGTGIGFVFWSLTAPGGGIFNSGDGAMVGLVAFLIGISIHAQLCAVQYKHRSRSKEGA